MKVGLVTYHRSTSYGACLQAYATQTELSKLGNDVIVIDYINNYEQRIKRVFFSTDGTFKSLLKNSIKSIIFGRSYWLKRAYRNFTNNYTLSSSQYRSAQDMNDLDFDALIVGSDQVWNSKISGKLDPVFLLDFGNTNKRISVASSFGSYILNNDERDYFVDCLRRFTSISVREQFAENQLSQIGINNVKVICDPTLMISVDEWNRFLVPCKYNGYLLTYFVSGSFKDFAERVSLINRNYNFPIYNVQSSNYHWNGVTKTFVGVTPEAFLGMIKNAEIVVTDSFHGTVFSVLFHKKVVVINNASNPIRIKELLKNLGMERVEFDGTDRVVEYNDKDFEKIDNKIEVMRVDAEKWINQALNS